MSQLEALPETRNPVAPAVPTGPVMAVATADRPRLAEGIELIGEYEDSGFKEAPSLARRADGQVIQLSRMLYAVAQQADGSHSIEEIAAGAGEDRRAHV